MTPADIWPLLEADLRAAGVGREARRRIKPESVADMWLVLYQPSGVRALRVAVGSAYPDLVDLPQGKGIDLAVAVGGDGSIVLEISLTNPGFADLFDAFVGDIAEVAARAASESDVPDLVTARVRRWQLFLKANAEGLTGQRQRGLYGELHVLGRIAADVHPDLAVRGWVGSDGAPQDFAFGGTAVEVKTSAGKNPQTVRISSERQLDDSVLDRIFLWHLSVDERADAGETLPAIVSRLRAELSGRAVQTTFEEALFAAGYLDIHASRYQTGYSLRASTIFEVRAGFPRLIEADCAAGLGDVQYSLELGALQEFLFPRDRLMNLLRTGVRTDA